MTLLGCIADDYTGATDVASMLSRAGLRVIQCFGIPATADDLKDFDAVVVALKTRSAAPDEAVQRSLLALAFLQSLGVDRFFFKYCSTFDSTAEGNIGPVADALATKLDAKQVLFCPAFPENGRTVYCGHLFVNGVPLHESSMRHHPLTPMTESNLVRVLQTQSTRQVASLPLKSEIPATENERHWIVDAISKEDLVHIAKLAKHHRLLTGASAIACYWAKTLCDGMTQATQQTASTNRSSDSVVQERCVILAGSCSEATRNQIAAFQAKHSVLHLDLASSCDLNESVTMALKWCDQQWSMSDGTMSPLLISTSANPDSVHAARSKLGERSAAEYAEQLLSGIAKELHQRGVRKFIVAGGETAGSVINALKIQSVRIGTEIAPGVPWITTLTTPPLKLSLKSGNFGGPNFFSDALELSP